MPVPNDTKEGLLNGAFDFTNDTLRVLLLDDSSAYTFDADAHEFVDDLDGSSDGDAPSNEPTDASYSRQTLTGNAVTEDTTDDEAVFDADDITFPSLSTTNDIQAVVVYRQVGGDDTTPADDEVLVVLDDATVGDLPIPTNGSDLVITWDAEGILNIG